MVSHPPAPGPDPEITIDLDGAPESDPEPEQSPARPRIPNAALAFTAVLLVLASGVAAAVKWVPDHAPAAEEAVRSFLEAVRAGEVEAALALVNEIDGGDQFLVPEALDSRWEIVEVAQVRYEEDRGGAMAEVYAEIEAYDGTGLGYRYKVRLGADGPVILNALASTRYSGFEELELNGHTAELSEQSRLLLLPGVYELYGTSQPSTLEFHGAEPVLAFGDQFRRLGGESAGNSLPIPWPELSPEGREALDEAVRSYLDSCAERAPVGSCPFAPTEDDRIAIPADATWEVTAYPQVGASYVARMSNLGETFELVTTAPGSVEVEAVVTEADGSERRTTLSCGIWVEGMQAAFTDDGNVVFVVKEEADDACRAMLEVE